MRHYVVTKPQDVEGFKECVLASAQTNTPLTITAVRQQSEFELRREGQTQPEEFELTVVSIILLPKLSAILNWTAEGNDLYFEENDGRLQFTVYV